MKTKMREWSKEPGTHIIELKQGEAIPNLDRPGHYIHGPARIEYRNDPQAGTFTYRILPAE